MRISPTFTVNCFRLAGRVTAGVAALATLSFVSLASAANLASDNAGNYTSATWVNGSNGGTGLSAWTLTNNSNGTTQFAGNFIGSSTAGSGNINSASGNSFGLFANPTGAPFSNADRSLVGTLSIGQTFSINLAVNFRNGNKGFNLLSGGTQVFNFNVGGDAYSYTAGTGTQTNTNFAYQADSVFTLAYTQQSATAGLFTISRTSVLGGATASNSVSVPLTTSGVSSFRLYNSGTDNGDAQNNLYFNNLAVVPEPSSLVAIGAGVVSLGVALRRRKG